MDPEAVHSPTRWLAAHGVSVPDELVELEGWWASAGRAVSEAVDRMGTPWLRMFDRLGERTDEVLYPPEHRAMLLRGYRAGAVWHALEGEGLEATFRIGYVTSFFDPGAYCPYTVSLATALAVHKYAEPAVRERFLPLLLRRDDGVWQGATWMTRRNRRLVRSFWISPFWRRIRASTPHGRHRGARLETWSSNRAQASKRRVQSREA